MKIKFNKFERVAGLFVLTAICGGIAVTVGVAVKKGWFEKKIEFETNLKNAEGLRNGTMVQMAGLRAGSVKAVELRPNNEVHVVFEISEKFHDRVRKDSVVRAIRPFIIGEKVLEISVGSETLPRQDQHAILRSEETMDVMDLVSGRSLGPSLASISKMTENLRYVAENLLDPERTKALVTMFDQLAPLVSNMNGMATEVTSLIKDTNKNKKLVKVVDNLVVMTDEVKKTLPVLNQLLPVLAKDSPQLAADLAKIARNVAVLTDGLEKTLPAFKDLGPELPRAGRRAIEALDETVVTLKALQKSFILKGNVEDVREEEKRAPASK